MVRKEPGTRLMVGFIGLVLIAGTGIPRAAEQLEQPAGCDTLGAGLVVVSVRPGGYGDVAGIEPGDRLISWRRPANPPANPQEAEGAFVSAFDRGLVEWEEAPRGPVVLTLEHDAITRQHTVPDAAWGIKALPRFSEPCLALYTITMDAVDRGDVEQAARSVRKIAAMLSSSGDQRNAAWLLSTVAEDLRPHDPGVMRELFAAALSAARSADCTICEGLVHYKMGRVLWLSGDPQGAEDAYLAALAIAERVASPLFLESSAHDQLGTIYEKTGRFEEAEQCYRQALQLCQTHAPDSFATALMYRSMGSLALIRGRLDEAEEQYRQYLAAARSISDENLDVAAALSNLGLIELSRDDFKEAARYFREVLRILETVSPDSLAVAHNLGNLGEIALLEGRLADATEHLQKALAISQRLAPDSADSASILSNLGEVARRMGDTDLARERFNRSLAIFKRLLPRNLPVADVLAMIGTLQTDEGAFGEAEATLEQALAISSRLVPGSAHEAGCHYRIGELHRRQGDVTGAVPHYLAAVDSLEAQVDRLGGGQETAGWFVASHHQLYGALISSLATLGRHAEAFQVLERSRAQQFRQILAERDLVFAAIPPELRYQRRQIAMTYDAVQAQLAVSDPERIEMLLELMADLRRQQQEIREEVRKLSPRLAALQYPEAMGVDEVRRSLDRGTVLLAYALTDTAAQLFVISAAEGPGEPFASLSLAGISEGHLEEEILAFNELIATVRPETEAAISQAGRSLYARLMAPAEPWLEQAERIVICADGPLHRLPFAALTRASDEADPTYLVEWKPLHLAASATVYAQLREAGRSATQPTAQTVVAFGDPQLPSQAVQGRVLQALPASRSEAEAVALVWGQAATAYLGADATEERAKQLAGADIVHFACHAVLDRRSPLDSALVLSTHGEAAGKRDNGLLQAWEIIEQVRLDARLLVLSACETALGGDLRGEGMIGLTRAFQYAGARSVVASLWPVADRSTAVLMRHFHEQLHAGLSIDEALRQAQLSLIRHVGEAADETGETEDAGLDSRQPYFWAGFELHGDWR